ncbi:hypothetical protein [Micromonospora sp. MH99]|nr:hypothetical protein [Micromonospora sp. MH99]MCF0091335.1 hypothetical protein [Micromonospora sp. MH99]
MGKQRTHACGIAELGFVPHNPSGPVGAAATLQRSLLHLEGGS